MNIYKNQLLKIGAVSALISMFPVSFLLALLWRFPIPFSGYESGINSAFKSIIAVGFYGILGGFIIVPGLGALAGVVAYQVSKNNKFKAKKLSITLGFLCALFVGIVMAILDKLIGSW